MNDTAFRWWSELRHGGLLISPTRLTGRFPESIKPMPRHVGERLLRETIRIEETDPAKKAEFIVFILENVCGLTGSHGKWTAGPEIGTEWSVRSLSGEVIRPRRIWRGKHESVLPLFIDENRSLGIGKGRRSMSRVIEWLRATRNKVALVTNYRQWRLVYAGIDHDAWAEWDTALWFPEGKPGLQLDALRILISPDSLTPPSKDALSPLLEAIDATRRGQAELSSSLGERVRQAVELLIQSKGNALDGIDAGPKDVYVAACRVIMRLVVVFFAEARDLLPRDNPLYHGSYGLQGLREELERHGEGAAKERLHHRYGAWPRVLGLFRLIFFGSCHEDLAIPRYGGGLFEPGDPQSRDGILRALSVFENLLTSPADSAVYAIIRLITRCMVRVRQGKGATFVEDTVDFSDLSTEYIGILYEGLLDFELRKADENDPVVFLNLGDQPALPLSRVEGMNDDGLSDLIEKLKKSEKLKPSGEDAEGEEEDDDAGDAEAEIDEEDQENAGIPAAGDAETIDDDDAQRQVRDRVRKWAVKAVTAGGLVKKPKGKKKDDMDRYERDAMKMADTLIAKTVMPGTRYLVRWGGTRKGAGTFYTRPGLAVPTVHRTLRPLAYNPPAGKDGRPDIDAPPAQWTPKAPDEIIALRTCDTSMGSASFLVSALRFLTDALSAGIITHGWMIENESGYEIPDREKRPMWFREIVTGLPADADAARARIAARLKRVVVEHCLYGVDIDPLAVELARLALWIETMDRDLPFEFLDHKLKCGNSLVGCWFDRFRHYPVMAWSREGGDKDFNNFVHHFREHVAKSGKSKGEKKKEGDVWTAAIKEKRSQVIDDLSDCITGQLSMARPAARLDPKKVHDEALALFNEMHAMPLFEAEARADFYREKILKSDSYVKLKSAFNAWCALWFWPADELDKAPMPHAFESLDAASGAVVERLAAEHRFFHWELEFPDVFAGQGSGFDTVLGNPPWETLQPMSKEFFSNIDPLYRALGKQDALSRQIDLFTKDEKVEQQWLKYNLYFKSITHWFRWASNPFGSKNEDDKLGSKFPRDIWADTISSDISYAGKDHPFMHQGEGKPYTYKMFLELKHALLREGGRMGIIIPSGLYTDKGSGDLRTLFLEKSDWQWLFGFENKLGIFDIHRSFKFCPVIVQKGDSTDFIRTAFMRHDLRDWEDAERFVLPYHKEQVAKFSPNTRSILEVRTTRDLEILEKIYSNSVLLGDQSEKGWGIKYAQGDFNMTSDSKLFKPRPWWEAQGYVADEYGRWLKGAWKERTAKSAAPPEAKRHTLVPGVILSQDKTKWIQEKEIEDVALPLYEGRMIGQFDFSQKGWVKGKGRSAEWREIPWEEKVFEPQYLMGIQQFRNEYPQRFDTLKIAFMDVTSSTNSRTMISAVVPDFPCNHKVPTLTGASITHKKALVLNGVLNSYVYDALLRLRFGATSLIWSVLSETTICLQLDDNIKVLSGIVSRLSMTHNIYSIYWFILSKYFDKEFLKRAYSSCEKSRLRCLLNAIITELYCLNTEDIKYILHDCDHPKEKFSDKSFTRTLDPKGFWRVDKEKDPELRHTVLTLAAFRDLKETIASCGGDRDKGIEAFCAQNDGDGWMLPETLRLADLGLGHDDRAKEHQPVRSRLGERFLPWQLEQTPEESWKECELHARNLLGEKEFNRLKERLENGETEESRYPEPEPSYAKVAEPKAKRGKKKGNSEQGSLF